MQIRRLQPYEEITGLGNLTVGDFWSWAYSDILSNRNRSVFAEFLVGAALGVLDKPRVEWDAVDLVYNEKKIEVKSAAYVQSWQQNNPSRIVYDVSKKKAWDAATNTYASELIRAADCYVFCLYTATVPERVNILNMAAWEFYVVPTQQIERELTAQKRVGINRIQSICVAVPFNDLKQRIDVVLGFMR